ncbi:NAD(P)H-dependent oxidoreductase [Paracoccus sp. p4-l81]|uniref:NAD(P)H-dependent oxidoreductase n=1 Tax=unclassified Paracoccus (in: a-proteobacteria) TaxID=2688777 RepID=UPI0035B7F30F
MNTVLILNAHPETPDAGALNRAFCDRAADHLTAAGYTVLRSSVAQDWDDAEEVAKHLAADAVILQTPVHWMGLPWRAKQYVDQVYNAGWKQLHRSDGRHRANPETGYGTGGLMQGRRYMLSLTYNAPRGAFDAPDEYLMQGRGVDDMFLPQHLNFRYMGYGVIPTFAAHDVLRNPVIADDFARFDAHLARHFPAP